MSGNLKINNEFHYFYKVIRNMNAKDKAKQSKINAHEIQADDNFYNLPSDFDIDEKMADAELTGWIELVENENLYKALKKLSIEDQIFISYIVKECRTQMEIAKIYGISHRAVGQKYQRLLLKIKKYIQNCRM